MGREVRMVPPDWRHPWDAHGRYKPLMDGFNAALKAYEEGLAKWNEGLVDDWNGGWKPKPADIAAKTFDQWHGSRPDPEDYMPDFPAEQRTHFQMYETTSEGTPKSPPMATAEDLARWLADNKVSAFAGMTATYEQWLATIERGGAPTMVLDTGTGQITSGVAGVARIVKEKP